MPSNRERNNKDKNGNQWHWEQEDNREKSMKQIAERQRGRERTDTNYQQIASSRNETVVLLQI